MFNGKEKDTETSKYIEILEKKLELEKKKGKADPTKITICIVSGIGCVMLIALLFYSILKSGFLLESILSTLLAFFSIFISIFFYFKADEASTKFYQSSYEFMKDISVTLGKIEERFGEKLNSLNDKVSHLDKISTEASEEIKDKKDDKDSIINDLMDKANLSAEERNKYRKELAEKDSEIEELRYNKYRAERDAKRLRERISQIEDEQYFINLPSKSFLEDLLRTHDTSNVTMAEMYELQKRGIIDNNGEVDDSSIIQIISEF